MNQNKLLKVWEIIRWLDEVRWNDEEMKQTLIPGRIYKDLGDSQKILVHWLTYITDQQRPYQDVWMKGGPIFAEIISDYVNKSDSSFSILKSFTNPSDKKGGVDIFTSKTQLIDGEQIKYTPRFGIHILSIAGTIYLLEQFNRNLIQYLSKNWDFIDKVKQESYGDNRVSRIAYLLYLLTYKGIEKGMVSLHRNENGIKKHMEIYSKRFIKLLADEDNLEEEFYRWSEKERYHKRLWAALRDYLKPNSYFFGHFTRALEELGNQRFKQFVQNKGEIVDSLELPGDIWNLRFIKKLFGKDISSPEDLRKQYENLKQIHDFGSRFFPEQFDVSFSFSPSMCDEIMDDYCPFRAGSQVRKFCLHSMGIQKTNNLCPVAMITCGYRYYCRPEDCPIKDGIKENLCSGCSIKIGVT